MSYQLSPEHIARIRDDARRLVQRAGDQEMCLQDLVQAAGVDVREAEATLGAVGREEMPEAQWHAACAARLSRSREHSDSARRACVSAREQHVAARRLLCRLDDERAGDHRLEFHDHAAGVLVVDDVEDTRELVAMVLRDAGFVVRTAVNGADALIAAYEMQPAVIVMDLMMPLLNGIEATRLIKGTPATRDAKVIAHTATPSLPDVLVDRLFAAVLPKPAAPDVLLAAVQSVASL